MAAAVTVAHPGRNVWRRVSIFAGYGGSVLLLQALRFGASIVCARVAGPVDWGFWTLLNTVLAYSYIADFGVVNGMNRDIALFRGRGDRGRVAAIANNSRSLVLCTSALCALAAGAFAFVAPDARVRTNLLVFALLLLLYKLFTFAQVYSMAHEDFGRVARANFCLAAATVPCLALVFAGGLRGYLWAQVLSFAVGGYLYIAPLAGGFRWALDRAELIRLAAGGLPIAAVGITATFISSIDRWLVAAFLGVGAVGQYSLVAIVWSTVSLVPQIVATRMYPRLAEAWGRTGDLGVMAGLLKESTRIGLALTASVVLAVEVLVPQLVERFLPAYSAGIPAMRVAAPGFLFQAAVYCYANLFNVIGKQRFMLTVQGVSAGFTLAATAGFLAMGWGLEGAALGATLGSCVYCGGLITATKRLLTKV